MEKKRLINLKNNMNPSQLELFQRLVKILPKMDERSIIEELLAMHILGIIEKKRIERILNHFGIGDYKGENVEYKLA
jgi:hypothetical protein